MTRFTLFLGLGVLAACSFNEARLSAGQAVTRFDSLYNAENYSTIYQEADDAFRTSTSEKDFITFMAAVRRKLGAHKSSEGQGWNVSQTTSGTRVSLAFRADFAEGSATESFYFRVSAGKPYLVGFNINSPLLVIR